MLVDGWRDLRRLILADTTISPTADWAPYHYSLENSLVASACSFSQTSELSEQNSSAITSAAYDEVIRCCRVVFNSDQNLVPDLAKRLSHQLPLIQVSSKGSLLIVQTMSILTFVVLIKHAVRDENVNMYLKLAMDVDTIMRCAGEADFVSKYAAIFENAMSSSAADLNLSNEHALIDDFEMQHAGVVTDLVKQLLRVAQMEHLTKCIELMHSLLRSLPVEESVLDFVTLELLRPHIYETSVLIKKFDAKFNADFATPPSVDLLQLLGSIEERRLWKYLVSQTHRLGLFEFQSSIDLLEGTVVLPSVDATGDLYFSSKQPTPRQSVPEAFNGAKQNITKFIQKISQSGRGSPASLPNVKSGSTSEDVKTSKILHV